MANHYFSTENAQTLRYAPDYLHIVVKVGSTTIMTFDKEDIISCVLTLRGVETKVDNPELQASTIDIEAYWPGSDSDIRSLRGKETVITYSAGYVNGDKSRTRTFYATFDEDGLKLENHVLTIKGTDGVGFCTGQVQEKLYFANTSTTRGAYTHYQFSTVMNKLMNDVVPRLHAAGTNVYISTGCPDWYSRTEQNSNTALDASRYLYIENKSYRKIIAQMMNFFRGCAPGTTDAYKSAMCKRFVFRDAGIPVAAWADDAVSGWRTSNSNQAMKTWNIAYDDVSDFKVDYGNPIKRIQFDYTSLSIDQNETTQQLEIETNNVAKIEHFEDPAVYIGYNAQGSGSGSYSYSYTWLDAKSLKWAATGTGNYHVTITLRLRFIRKSYRSNAAPPCWAITTGLSNGDTITLDPIYGQKVLFDQLEQVVGEVHPFSDAMIQSIIDCGIKQPTWINFTWRGNPDMMPRDMIIFTEKDGTRNYYEIDNLTLEHKDGGMISKVKAIYKRPYTG